MSREWDPSGIEPGTYLDTNITGTDAKTKPYVVEFIQDLPCGLLVELTFRPGGYYKRVIPWNDIYIGAVKVEGIKAKGEYTRKWQTFMS